MPPPAALLPSVLDRLVDPASMRQVGLGAIVEEVRRDVEDLLNDRRVADPAVDRFPELSRSVFTYGAPEFVSRPADTPADRASLSRLLSNAIALHEPRLAGVRATLVGDATKDRALRFLISGSLRADAAPGVEFETVVKLATGQAAVRPAGP